MANKYQVKIHRSSNCQFNVNNPMILLNSEDCCILTNEKLLVCELCAINFMFNKLSIVSMAHLILYFEFFNCH